MKKLFALLVIGLTVIAVKAQNINVELWGENTPVVFQCHTEGTAGDYGKMISDQQLEFWEGEDGGIDMRWSYDVTYSKGYPKSGAYIYHGKREGNKIIFDTYEDGDAMEGTSEVTQIDKSYAPYELEIASPTTLIWDRCTYRKMAFDLNKGAWVPAE